MEDKSESYGNNLSWSNELEDYIKTTGEQARALAWLHKKCEHKFTYLRNWIELPVIVLSAVVGFCSVGSSTIFYGKVELSSILLGCISLFVSVLNTVNSYFSWSKRAEGHRIASLQYDRLHRYVVIELSLPRSERMNPGELLKHVREFVDRLSEISPQIDNKIIYLYKREIMPAYATLSHPVEVNGLVAIRIVRDKMHLSTPTSININSEAHPSPVPS